jgi:hypothetical protein
VGEIVVMIEVAVVGSAARGGVARFRMDVVATVRIVGAVVVVTARRVIGSPMVVVHTAIVQGAVVFGMHDLAAAVLAGLAHLGAEIAHAATEIASAKVAAAAKVTGAAKPTTETTAEVTTAKATAARVGVGCQTKSAKRNRYGQCDS